MLSPTHYPSKILLFGLASVLIVGIIFALSHGLNEPTNDLVDSQESSAPIANTPTSAKPDIPTPSITTVWSFDFNAERWLPSQTPPSCPTPLNMASPTTISSATNILYPGQIRGGNYKPHGGFRFDSLTTNAVPVTLALDALLFRGSRYIEAGEIQTMLDFIHPCGYLLRYDHLLTLTPEFQALVDANLPEPQPDESRTHNFPSGLTFTKGTPIASEVGFRRSKNVSFDFGVYDLRTQNDASKLAAFQQKVGNFKELSYFGTCWLDLLPGEDATTAKRLPGSGTEGKTSDYCR